MIFVLKNDTPIKVITLLKIYFPNYSKYEIKKLMEKGKVLLNNEPVFDFDKTAYVNDEIKCNGKFIKIKSNIVKEDNKQLDRIKHKVGKQKIWNEFSESKILDTDIERLSIKLHKILTQIQKTLSIAESCTGGLLQEIITRNSGSSHYFLGGVVTYSLDSKKKLLDVKKDSLSTYGAVSYEVAKEMVYGVKNLFNSNIAISITGIAGPTGGTEQKPVGTVHYAILIDNDFYHKKLSLKGQRQAIRKKTAIEIMKRLIRIFYEKYREL